MIASEAMSVIHPNTTAEYLTVDEGSQDVQRFDKPVSGTGQRLHEGGRRLYG